MGAALLLTSLFVSWYSVSAAESTPYDGSTYSLNATSNYFPLNHYSESFACNHPDFRISNFSGSYSQSGWDSIGGLYDTVVALVVGGAALGLVAAAVGVMAGRKTRWSVALVAVAVLLSALAPTVLYLSQPSVLQSQGSPYNGPSPKTSFFGSCQGGGCNTSLATGETLSASWGPSIGWYLAMVAVVPFVLSLVLLRRTSRGPAYSGLNDGMI